MTNNTAADAPQIELKAPRRTILPKRVVLDLAAYEKPKEGRRDFVRLDFCENTEGFPAAYPRDMPADWASSYPEYSKFCARLADFYNIDESCIMLTNGSDEGISVVCNTFIEPGEDWAIISSPCFSMFAQCLRLAGASLKSVSVKPDLSFDLDGINTALNEGAKVALFASPENPTGAMIPAEQIDQWCIDYPDTLFVIDEAYGEFSKTSVLAKVKEFSNLLVLKTFSKAWGMAGLRLGCVFGQRELVEYMRRVALPYSVNAAALWTADKLLNRAQDIYSYVESINLRKQQLVEDLENRNYVMVNGAGNSVLLSVGINAESFASYCYSSRILVRNRSTDRHFDPMWGRVRISVGTDDEQKKLIEAVDNFSSTYGVIFDLDDTLVDTSVSFDQVVAELVLKYSGRALDCFELKNLREEGGFNDDWEATVELLRRRQIAVDIEQLKPEAISLYLQVAPKTEKLSISLEILERLRQRHPLFIVSGRRRVEYEQVWANTMDPLFKRVYCVDDLADCRAKPWPDYLSRATQDFNLRSGVYIGNSVDDMKAASQAGLTAIGLTTTTSEAVLRSAGAQIIINDINQLEQIFQLRGIQ